MSQLNELGLSEREAVEYVLMLSRDEEARRASQEEGVFEVDMDETSGDSSGSGPRRTSAASSPSISPPLHPTTPSSSSKLIAPPSGSNVVQIQISPRFHPEPTNAGELSTSPLNLNVAPIAMQQAEVAREEFPRMSPPECSSSSPAREPPPMARTDKAKQNAWRKPLKTPPSASPPAARRAPRQASPPSSSSNARGGPSSHSDRRYSPSPTPRQASPPRFKSPDIDWEAEMARISMIEDQELKFALELSLAEARSQQSG